MRYWFTIPSIIEGSAASIADLQISSGIKLASEEQTCKPKQNVHQLLEALKKGKIGERKKFDLFNPSDNIRLCVLAGEPLVKVVDDVDAEVAYRDVLRGWGGGLALTTNCT